MTTLAERRDQALAAIRAKKDLFSRIEGLLVDADEEAMELLRGIFGSATPNQNGTNGHSVAAITAPAQQSAPPRQRRLPSGSGRGDIKEAIRKAVFELKTNITVVTIQAAMERNGVHSSAKRPGATIRPVLARMASEGELRETEPSRGTKPAVFATVGGNM